MIHAICAANPDLSIVVQSGHVEESLAALVSGRVDIMIGHEVHAASLTDAFAATPVYRDELTAVVRADCDHGSPEDLFSLYPVAVQPPKSLSRQYFERWARDRDITVRSRFEFDVFDGILSQVMFGQTIGILGGYVARLSPLRDQLVKLALPDFQQRRDLVAIHPSMLKPRAREFIEALGAFYEAGPARSASAVGVA